MKKNLFPILIIFLFNSCEKTYVCNCASQQGELPYKKVYLNAKTDKSAEKKCTKIAEGTEVCTFQ